MTEQQQKEHILNKFTKLWQIFEDDLKERKFYIAKECQKNVNVMVILKCYMKNFDHNYYNNESLGKMFDTLLQPKFKISRKISEEEYFFTMKCDDKQELINRLKKYHKKTGLISYTYLNAISEHCNGDMHEILNLLKEMDV